MKNAKREVVERLVPFNYGEIEFLDRLCNYARNSLPNEGTAFATRALVDRCIEKLSRARRARYPR